MLHKENLKPGKIVIDLAGPQGNVFVLIGIAVDIARATRCLPVKEVQAEMMSGDYEHAVRYMNSMFGDVVDFYNAPFEM